MGGNSATVLPLLAWLTSGFAALAVAPGNRAAQVLCGGAAAFAASNLLTPFVARAPATVSGAVLVALQNACFFIAVLAIAALLICYPHGRFVRRWHGRALWALAAVAVLTELLFLVAAPRMSLDGSGAEGITRANPLAVPALALLAPVADLLWSTTPAWPLLALVALVDRWRVADADGRRELRYLLIGFGVLAALLVVVIASILSGWSLPQPGFTVVFTCALAVLPVVLLVGIARRTRSLDSELAASRSRLISAEDRVRREIERDLHDGIQTQLVAILSLTRLARRQAVRDATLTSTTLDDVTVQVTGAIEGLRELVSGIRPPVLKDAGVGAALASRLERLPTEVSLDVSGPPVRRWDDAVEAAAYFVGCEAVTNALKHALKHAPGVPVVVRVVEAADELTVQVDDAGPGITGDWPRGRGLSGLADRVESLGGEFRVGPSRGGGTRVLARFRAWPV